MDSLYWTVRWNTYSDWIKELSSLHKEELVAISFNEVINKFISNYADFKQDESDKKWHWKRIPYIWWYWRPTDFYNKNISIWDCGSFIWIMENNKWDYPERYLTETECEPVLEIIWKAKLESEKWWSLGDIERNTLSELDKLWDLFQTFNI